MIFVLFFFLGKKRGEEGGKDEEGEEVRIG
jgi:hypothetical protein